MLVQASLCRTWSETTLLVFPRGGSNVLMWIQRNFLMLHPSHTAVMVGFKHDILFLCILVITVAKYVITTFMRIEIVFYDSMVVMININFKELLTIACLLKLPCFVFVFICLYCGLTSPLNWSLMLFHQVPVVQNFTSLTSSVRPQLIK